MQPTTSDTESTFSLGQGWEIQVRILNQALRTHQARCKSSLLRQACSGRSTDQCPPNSLLVTMLLLSETFIASHLTSASCCSRNNGFEIQIVPKKRAPWQSTCPVVTGHFGNCQGELKMAKVTNVTKKKISK